MLNSSRDKSEGVHLSGEGGGGSACYVNPGLGYETEKAGGSSANM